MNSTSRYQAATALACLAAVLGAGMSVGVAAQELSSPNYRIPTSGFATAGGNATSGSFRLESSAGEAAPVGQVAGEQFQATAGAEVPAPLPEKVARILRMVLKSGWNMKGSPVLSDKTVGAIFRGDKGYPIKIGNLYYYQSGREAGYVESDDADPLPPNLGFWVFSYWGGTSREFSGEDGSNAELVEQLEPGWNLYTPTRYVTVPQRGEIAVVWRWDAEAQCYVGVDPGENLVPLEGYWIYK
jgi:hypothetical protein